MGSSRRTVLAGLAAGLVLALALATTSESSATAAPDRPAWVPTQAKLVFADTFEGSSIDGSRWMTCYPWADPAAGCTNAGNAEQQWYLPSQARVSGGELQLVAERKPTVGVDRAGNPYTYPYRSGIVTTARRFEFTYGFIEFRARIPRGQAMWPALWLLPRTLRWPPEIDIMEAVGQHTSGISATLHPASGSQVQSLLATTDLSVGWHTFGLAWRSGKLTWYVDGAERFVVRSGVPAEPMYLLANLAVGGTGGGRITLGTPATARLEIDAVRVWQ